VAKNEGTHTALERDDANSFKRVFLCLNSFQRAFKFCRPMVILGACHVKSKHQGVIFSASAHDGVGKIVPLAVGIAHIEDQGNCTFFLENIKTAIPEVKLEGMVIMHDREKGLHAAQVVVFPLAQESICAFHLEKNVNVRFKSKFEGLIWKATKSTTSVEYEAAIDGIRQANPEAV
jgi:hypothetical protein